MHITDFNIKTIGDGTPIIMLHGFQLDQVSLIAACEPLLEGSNTKRVYLDLPGMGMNQKTEGITNADEMIAALIKLIQEIIGDQPFYLLGMSYGGYLARGISKNMNNQCLGMFLLVPVVYPKFTDRIIPRHEVVYEDYAYTQTLEPEMLDALRQGNVVITKSIVERQAIEIDQAVERGNATFLETYQQNGYQASFNVDEHAENCDIPIWIVAGKQDSIVGFEDQFNMSKLYKRASYFLVDGAGHGLHYEKEISFNQLFKLWISQMEAH